MTTLSREQATTILRNLGWRIRTTTEYTSVVKRFQAGWNLGAALAVDGKVGPATSAALLLSESRRRAGRGTASAHFSFVEVACKCGGYYASCPRIWQKRRAFQMMETYRAKSGRALYVISGCRCTSHNRAVGGHYASEHLNGLAIDVSPVYTTSTVRSWRCANGIGYGRYSWRVRHIDRGRAGSLTYPNVFPDGY